MRIAAGYGQVEIANQNKGNQLPDPDRRPKRANDRKSVIVEQRAVVELQAVQTGTVVEPPISNEVGSS